MLLREMAAHSNYMKLITAVTLCVLIILVVIPIYKPKVAKVVQNTLPYNESVKDKQIRKLIKQRNSSSKTLNDLLQKYGKLQCSLNGDGLDKTGGWCKKESSQPDVKGSKHITDKKLIKELTQLFKGKRVASFGDGPGMYKKFLDATGLLECYDAYDGAPYAPDVTEGRVKYLDLSVPQYGLPIYDWIMSLEVAEHIPKEYENMFLSNIARHASIGVVLSWAVPGQGGFHHVNNQPLSHVILAMKQLGFQRSDKMSTLLQSQSELPWLKSNVNVYYRLDNHHIDEDDA